MRIGDHDLSRDQARHFLVTCARDHHETVLWYDLAGLPSGRPGPGGAAEPVDGVTIADIGRLVIIAAQLTCRRCARSAECGHSWIIQQSTAVRTDGGMGAR